MNVGNLFWFMENFMWWESVTCSKGQILGRGALAAIGGWSGLLLLNCASHILRYKTRGSCAYSCLCSPTWPLKSVGQNHLCSVGPVIDTARTTGMAARAQIPVRIRKLQPQKKCCLTEPSGLNHQSLSPMDLQVGQGLAGLGYTQLHLS